MTSKFITGKTGVGKTYQAKNLLELAKKDYDRDLSIRLKYHPLVSISELYKFYSIPKLLIEAASSPKRALELIREATLAEVVVLDDLGTNKISSYNPDIVYIIVNDRLEKAKATIVTSNLTIPEIDTLIDGRLASRLATFEIIEITGKDRRVA